MSGFFTEEKDSAFATQSHIIPRWNGHINNTCFHQIFQTISKRLHMMFIDCHETRTTEGKRQKNVKRHPSHYWFVARDGRLCSVYFVPQCQISIRAYFNVYGEMCAEIMFLVHGYRLYPKVICHYLSTHRCVKQKRQSSLQICIQLFFFHLVFAFATTYLIKHLLPLGLVETLYYIT